MTRKSLVPLGFPDGSSQNTALYDEHLALKNFHASKGRIASRSSDWLFLGDSLADGYFATSHLTKWIQVVRNLAQANLNPAGCPGGRGYIRFVQPTDPATTVSIYGDPALPDQAVLSGGATAQRSSGLFGLGQTWVNLPSSTATCTFTTGTVDRFWLLFAQGNSVGNMSIAIDGGAAVIVPTYNATDIRSGRIWDSGALTRGVHTVVIKADNTAGAPANIYNVVVEGVMEFNGDGAPGPANILTAEWANIDSNYDVCASGQFWNVAAGYHTACTVATTTAQAFQGTKSIAMTCTGAANPLFVSGQVQCKAYQRYTYSFRVRSAATPRSFSAAVNFFADNNGATGSFLGSMTGSTVTSTTSGWTTVSVTGIAPATAAWFQMIPELIGTPAASEVHYFDAHDFGLTSYTGAGVINTAHQDPSSGAAQGRGVRVWEASHWGYQASDFIGNPSIGLTSSTTGTWIDCLDAVNPDVIFIAFGTNEQNLGTSAATLRDNLVALKANVAARCLTVQPTFVLLAMWPFATTAFQAAWTAPGGYRDKVREAARTAGVGFLDVGALLPVTAPGIGTGDFPQPNPHDLLVADGCHVLDPGQKEIAQTVFAYLLSGDPRPTVTAPVNNYTATTDPVVGSDITLGYLVGSTWVNTTRKIVWQCADATAGAAVWTRLTYASAARSSSTSAIANTETQVLSLAIPASRMIAGTTYRIRAGGLITNTATATSAVFRIRIGTTTLTGNIPASITAALGTTARTNMPFSVDAEISIYTTGGAGTVLGWINVNIPNAVVPVISAPVTAAVAIDTTAVKQVELTAISGGASSTLTFTSVEIVEAA